MWEDSEEDMNFVPKALLVRQSLCCISDMMIVQASEEVLSIVFK